ncbi:cytochrome P450 [Rhizobium lemnae]|uniref:Cytochrome P450 n=1 Tax=Rhizobium lemnae TaxID=1214924 RepID=A0ABV8EDM8_9HYPH|nr:cytochrome P450 [Rhizobium lemnae]MCJ8507082.1 cytochrome P450 [Rhizobium lemnae]
MLLGNSIRFRWDPLSFLSACQGIDGPIVAIEDGLYLVSGPELIETILHNRDDIFLKTGSSEAGDMVSFPSSLMNSSGEDWSLKRRAMQPDFTLRRVASGLSSTRVITEAHLEQWQTGPRSGDIRKLLQELCLDVGCQFLLGTVLDEEGKEAFLVLSDAIILKTREPVRLPLHCFDRTSYRLTSAREAAKAVARAAIARAGQEHGKAGSNNWIGSFVNRTSVEDAEWLCDEFCAMVLSGIEPMSAGLTWTLHLLTSHPDVLQRVIAEVDALSSSEWAAGEGLAGLHPFPEARASLLEALRLFPPAWLTGRTVARDTMLGDFFLAAGSAVMISPWINHRSARFFDEPDRFRPDRWMDGTLQQRLPRYAFFPFGGGIRRCIGEHFSLTHMAFILVCILKRFILKPPSKTQVKAYPALVLRPLGVKLALMPRATAAY